MTEGIPFLPDRLKWQWHPESQVLRSLGFSNRQSKRRGDNDPKLSHVLGSILDRGDPRRLALRAVLEELAVKHPDMLGEFRFQADHVLDSHYSATSALWEGEREEGKGRKPHQPIVQGFFCDPQLLIQRILTRSMVLEKLREMGPMPEQGRAM